MSPQKVKYSLNWILFWSHEHVYMFHGVPAALFLVCIGLQFGDGQSRKRNQVCPARGSLCPACCHVWEGYEASSSFYPAQFGLLCFLLWSLIVHDPKLHDWPCKTKLACCQIVCFFWVIPCHPFYQNTFLFSDLNVHFDPRTCLWQWRCGRADHGAEGYQSLLSALSSWKWVSVGSDGVFGDGFFQRSSNSLTVRFWTWVSLKSSATKTKCCGLNVLGAWSRYGCPACHLFPLRCTLVCKLFLVTSLIT